MKRTLITVAVAGTLVAAGGVAYAAIPSSSGVIKGCYDSGGNLKVVDEAKPCPKGYTVLTWNQAGQPGTPGAEGADGADGVNGINGTDGADGAPGADGADGVSGYEIVSLTRLISTGEVMNYPHTVWCPTGKKAIGGGGSAVVNRPTGITVPSIMGSIPAINSNGQAWTIFYGMGNGTLFEPGDDLNSKTYAICADVG